MIDTNVLLAIAAGCLILALLFGATFAKRRLRRSLNKQYYTDRWKELQKFCGDKQTWPLAIIDADKLVDEALKQSRVKGKTMGERLVSAQRDLSNNDAIWFAHKLRNKLVHEQYTGLKERDVKEALVGFRQALKDMGALK